MNDNYVNLVGIVQEVSSYYNHAVIRYGANWVEKVVIRVKSPFMPGGFEGYGVHKGTILDVCGLIAQDEQGIYISANRHVIVKNDGEDDKVYNAQ